MDYFIQMFKIVFVLGIFVVLTYVASKQLKKKQLNKTSVNRFIQVLDGVQIGRKDEIVLMKVGEEYILLSTNSGQMLALEQKMLPDPKENFESYFKKESDEKSEADLTKVENIRSFVLKYMERFKKKVSK